MNCCFLRNVIPYGNGIIIDLIDEQIRQGLTILPMCLGIWYTICIKNLTWKGYEGFISFCD